MTKPFGLSKSERISAQGHIDPLFRSGRIIVSSPLRCHWVVRHREEGEPAAAILVSVPKKYHKRANKRNLLKRHIREAYRLHKGGLWQLLGPTESRVDIAFVYTTKEIADHQTIVDAVVSTLQRIERQIAKRQAKEMALTHEIIVEEVGLPHQSE